jgi:hypothetical protein
MKESKSESKQQHAAQSYVDMSDGELRKLATEAWSLTETGKEALRHELEHRGLEIVLAKSGAVDVGPEMAYLSSLISRRDRIALLVGIGLGFGFGYLTSLAGNSGFIIGGLYIILGIPGIVIFADQRRLSVWQVCVMSFVLSLFAGNSGDYPWRRGEFQRVTFVCWSLVTVFSSPIPAGFLVLRFKGSVRYFVGIAIAVVAFAVLILVHRITG